MIATPCNGQHVAYKNYGRQRSPAPAPPPYNHDGSSECRVVRLGAAGTDEGGLIP
jgi:hypothetical protein